MSFAWPKKCLRRPSGRVAARRGKPLDHSILTHVVAHARHRRFEGVYVAHERSQDDMPRKRPIVRNDLTLVMYRQFGHVQNNRLLEPDVFFIEAIER